MLVPVMQHAPVVRSWARNFKSVFANEPEYQHCKNYLTGLIVAERKNFSQIARCMVQSADHTNVDRFMNNQLWSGTRFNDRRVEFIYERTKGQDASQPGDLVIDDTLDEHVGTLFEHIARHYDHCDGSYKLAQNPVTSHYVRGSVSFPIDFRTYRTYDEATDWEAHFRKHFPDVEIPKESKARSKLKVKYEKKLLALDREFAQKHQAFKTKITLACELVEDAIGRELDFSVVLFDAWYLAPKLVEKIEKYGKAWISLLRSNRKLETASLRLYDEQGNRLVFDRPEIKIEELIPRIPKSAYKAVAIDPDTRYWVFSFTARLKTLGKVRLVVSFPTADCTGSYAVLVTRQIHWEAKKIIRTYCRRFQIEVFYKDAKQQLGFSDYQCRKEEAIGKHWYMVFCAYSLLKLDMLQTPAYQAWQRKLKTISVALQRQAQSVIEQLILACHRILSREPNPEHLFKLLFGKLAYQS